MKTQIELVREDIISTQMNKVARDENEDPDIIRNLVAKDEIVILYNPNKLNQKVSGIGIGLQTKINVSIGTSSDIYDIKKEVLEAIAAEEEGANTLIKLSTDGNMDVIRRSILLATLLPVGNVPLYQAFKETAKKYKNLVKFDPKYLFHLIEQQHDDGITLWPYTSVSINIP